MESDRFLFLIQIGRLLELVGDIATAIRMRSAYAKRQITQEDSEAVMWLADSLHNLLGVGQCLKNLDFQNALFQVQGVRSTFEDHLKSLEIPDAKWGNTARHFQPVRGVQIDLKNAISLFVDFEKELSNLISA